MGKLMLFFAIKWSNPLINTCKTEIQKSFFVASFLQSRGRQPTASPSKTIRPAATLSNCSNCVASLVVLNFVNLPCLQLLVLDTYEELGLLVRNRTAQELY